MCLCSNSIEELKQASSEVLLLVMRCCMENSVAAKLWMQESFKVSCMPLPSPLCVWPRHHLMNIAVTYLVCFIQKRNERRTAIDL